MTSDQITSKLEHLRENLRKLESIPQASFEEFRADFRSVDSALYRLQTSIQALIDLACLAAARLGLPPVSTSREILDQMEQHGHLPAGSSARFGPMFSFRNRIVHLYDRVDPEIVYRILRENRGDLVELGRLLSGLLEADRPAD